MKTLKLTDKELIAACEIELNDLHRLLNETNEQRLERMAFFGDDCDKGTVTRNRIKYLTDLIRNNA